jgi:hypothetical protein
MNNILVLKESGRKKVKITNYGFGIEIYIMRNGWQWSGSGVDDQLLLMIKDSIEEYFKMEQK